MNNTIDKTAKRVYFQPRMECVKLDNDISLQLISDPPDGPGETFMTPAYFNNNPFAKDIIA